MAQLPPDKPCPRMASPALSAQASFKKTPGTLTVDLASLSWAPATPPAPGVKQAGAFTEALSKVLGACDLGLPAVALCLGVCWADLWCCCLPTRSSALFASKPETGKHNLKLTFYPSSSLAGDKGVTFNFSHAQTAQDDAARVKAVLAGVAAQNRLDKAGPPGVEPVDVKPVIHRPPLPPAAAATAGAPAAPSAAGGPNQPPATAASSSTSSSAPASKPVVTAPASPSAAAKGKGRNLKEDWELHKRVLVKNPQLAALHYELVQSGQITDDEFWEGREVRRPWSRTPCSVRARTLDADLIASPARPPAAAPDVRVDLVAPAARAVLAADRRPVDVQVQGVGRDDVRHGPGHDKERGQGRRRHGRHQPDARAHPRHL